MSRRRLEVRLSAAGASSAGSGHGTRNVCAPRAQDRRRAARCVVGVRGAGIEAESRVDSVRIERAPALAKCAVQSPAELAVKVASTRGTNQRCDASRVDSNHTDCPSNFHDSLHRSHETRGSHHRAHRHERLRRGGSAIRARGPIRRPTHRIGRAPGHLVDSRRQLRFHGTTSARFIAADKRSTS